ncbi:alpha/beta hydrolase [Paracoccus aminophilus]|uniref:Lipase n=1 Tax=Paracoccus aminophilus JCM 7686 TaxID=1367847 RepID=S5XRQ0_PARAH|nr:alpha/beta hydrolase [Paracoccus aminophilus]AGT07782.1 lipase [Paracoccus aminophilus JCM 7686]
MPHPETPARRLALYAAALLCLSAFGAVAQSRPQVVIGGPDISRDMFPEIHADFPNGVRVLPNVTFWSPQGFRPLTMDIYQPPPEVPRPKTGWPMLMFIHGGGWIGGNSHYSNPIADFPELLAAISARGYVVTAVNYRLSNEAKWPAQAQDIKAAIRFLRAKAGLYGVDPARFAVWGLSAGGQLAAVAATTCGLSELQPTGQYLPELPPPPPQASTDATPAPGTRVSNHDCVQAAIGWYGVYDMSTLTAQARLAGAMSREDPGAPEWRLLGCMGEGCNPEKIATASAMQSLSFDAPPMQLVAGDSDKVVPPAQTLEFAGALASAGIDHEVTIIKGVGHNFSGSDPSQTQKATQQALDEMLAFLERYLPPQP